MTPTAPRRRRRGGVGIRIDIRVRSLRGRMERREFLAAAGAVGVGATAGCAGLFETDENTEGSGGEPALVENRPDAVYYPTHREGMKMAGMGMAGDLSVGLMYSYPHRFWTM